MNNFYKKKDFKTLLLLFSIEAVILVFMCVIAHFITSDNIVRNQNNNDFTSSMSLVSEEVLGKSFNGKGISALKNLNSIENDNNTETKDQICKFYTFNLSDEGITSNLLRASAYPSMLFL